MWAVLLGVCRLEVDSWDQSVERVRIWKWAAGGVGAVVLGAPGAWECVLGRILWAGRVGWCAGDDLVMSSVTWFLALIGRRF